MKKIFLSLAAFAAMNLYSNETVAYSRATHAVATAIQQAPFTSEDVNVHHSFFPKITENSEKLVKTLDAILESEKTNLSPEAYELLQGYGFFYILCKNVDVFLADTHKILAGTLPGELITALAFIDAFLEDIASRQLHEFEPVTASWGQTETRSLSSYFEKVTQEYNEILKNPEAQIFVQKKEQYNKDTKNN